jgi:hypothetical protein
MVIVHIYDELNKSCRKMNTAVGQLANSFSHVKFLRMPVAEAPNGSGICIYISIQNYEKNVSMI